MPKTKSPKQPKTGDAPVRKKNLTPKQQKFADLYLELGNASEAYRRAYSAARMSNKTIGKRAQELLNHGAVAGYIARIQGDAQRKAAEKYEVTLEKLTRELLPIAFADAGDFYAWGPDGVTIKDSAGLTRDQRAIVSEVSQTITPTGGTIRVKLHDKLSAIQQLAKLHGLVTDKMKVDADGPIVPVINVAISPDQYHAAPKAGNGAYHPGH